MPLKHLISIWFNENVPIVVTSRGQNNAFQLHQKSRSALCFIHFDFSPIFQRSLSEFTGRISIKLRFNWEKIERLNCRFFFFWRSTAERFLEMEWILFSAVKYWTSIIIISPLCTTHWTQQFFRQLIYLCCGTYYYSRISRLAIVKISYLLNVCSIKLSFLTIDQLVSFIDVHIDHILVVFFYFFVYYITTKMAIFLVACEIHEKLIAKVRLQYFGPITINRNQVLVLSFLSFDWNEWPACVSIEQIEKIFVMNYYRKFLKYSLIVQFV